MANALRILPQELVSYWVNNAKGEGSLSLGKPYLGLDGHCLVCEIS